MKTETRIIVLNGGSSSGKTTIARRLQAILPDPWLFLSIDDLVDALPPSLNDADADADNSGNSAATGGITFGSTGQVAVGEGFRAIEAAWMTGIAAMARAGARIILDDVYLSGGASQERIRPHFDGLGVLWVGVRCDPAVAAARELARGDRTPGMAASQAAIVHAGVRYDLEIDTAAAAPLDCARLIAARLRGDGVVGLWGCGVLGEIPRPSG